MNSTLELLRYIKYKRTFRDVKIGEFQYFEHPPKAIRFSRTDFSYYTESKNRIDYCPSCNKEYDNVHNHGDAWRCGCGLNRQIYGNSIYVWFDIGVIYESTLHQLENNKNLIPATKQTLLLNETN